MLRLDSFIFWAVSPSSPLVYHTFHNSRKIQQYMQVISTCNIDANSLVFFDLYEGFQRSKKGLENSLNNLKDNCTKGKISNAARKKIIRGVNLMHALSLPKKFKNPDTGRTSTVKTSLITLTLPAKQIHSDQKIKAIALNRFLETMRYDYNMKTYLWRAESQKNGNIHFHIQTNIVAHHREIRDIWNTAINKLGYVDQFAALHGHDSPNSSDIHAVYKIANLGAYVAKYMTKENNYRPIDGRQWFLSQNLSKIKPISLPYYGSLADEIEAYCQLNAKRIIYLEMASVAYASFFTDDLQQFPQLQKARTDYLNLNIPLIN